MVNDLCIHRYEAFSPSPSSNLDLGLGAAIWTLGLEFGPQGWDLCVEDGILV